MIRFVALAILALGISACASLSEEDCREGDWRRIGFNDGADGRTQGFLQTHAKACAEYGIAPDAAHWETGRQEGLALYCRPARAYSEGAKGRALRDVCPIAELASLERAHNRGLIWYRIGRDIAEAERQISRIDNTLGTLSPDDPTRMALISDRAALRLEIVTLRAERLHYR